MDKGIDNILYETYIKPIYGIDYEILADYIIHKKIIKKEGNDFNIASYRYNESKNTIELLDKEGNLVNLDSKVSSKFFIHFNEKNKESLSAFQSGFSKTAWDSVIETIEKKLQEKQDNQTQTGAANVANNGVDLGNHQDYSCSKKNSSFILSNENVKEVSASNSYTSEKPLDSNSQFNDIKDVYTFFKYLLTLLLLIVFAKAYHGFTVGSYIGFYNMSPTIKDGSVLVSSRVPITLKGINRGDIVVANVDFDNGLYRVVGMPKETIEQRSDGVYINNVLYEESYIDESNNVNSKDWQWSFILGENEYFLLSDNRDYDACDSRVYGPIESNYIIQKVLFK